MYQKLQIMLWLQLLRAEQWEETSNHDEHVLPTPADRVGMTDSPRSLSCGYACPSIFSFSL